MNIPEHVCDSANTGGQNLQILKVLNVMVTPFCIEGGRGGGGGKCMVVRLVRLKAIQMHASVSVG